MILIGHKLVPFEPLYNIKNIEDIKKTPSNSIVIFDFDNEELLEYCTQNEVSFSLHVDTLRDAIIANALRAKYILVYKKLSVLVQNIAQEYLFDAKILLYVEENADIEEVAQDGIDGIIMKCAIIDV